VAPQRAIAMMGGLIKKFGGLYKFIKRMMPYLPSFRRIAARIMEPATGASTCALGSHRWNINKGILTKKARIDKIHKKAWIFGEYGAVYWRYKNVELFFCLRKRIIVSRGKEASTV